MEWIKSIFFLMSVFVATAAIGQEKCATVEIRRAKRNSEVIRETEEGFENWITQRRAAKNGRIDAFERYVIPVVVHVIHKGEVVGSGSNISDAQIASQIRVLNKDFTRTNTDAAATPSEFANVAGSINIQFVLATSDPSGAATNGIVRKKGSKTTWSTTDETTLKAISYWPAEDYLNIWVTDLSSTLLGYAQFPVSDLDGLEDAQDNRLTDGVVIDYSVFGSIDDGAFSLATGFKKGRTTTHEVGHFFGLRHTWGDDNGSCSGSGDYVSDTPNQGNSTSGCPSHPQTSCTVHTMFQNYMDYTNDDCMNLFTVGQVSRMVTVLENSPRRLSLLSSHGTYDPTPVENDLGMVAITSPSDHACAGNAQHTVAVVNNGTNSIHQTSLQITVNGVSVLKEIEFTPVLAPGDTALVEFQTIVLAEGSNPVKVEIIATNGFSDGKTADNLVSTSVYAPYARSLPYHEQMNVFPSAWHQLNDKTKVSWEKFSLTRNGLAEAALYLDLFNSSLAEESNVLLTPTFDLTNAQNPYAVFDIAYARSKLGDSDGLQIFVMTDCGGDPETGTLIYQKKGGALSTSGTVASAFVPSDESQWRREVIDLHAYMGAGSIRLAFVGLNDGGNNIYLDNFAISDNVTENVTISSVDRPAPVSCASTTNLVLTVTNSGTMTVNGVKLKYTINGDEKTIVYSGLNLAPAGGAALTVQDISFTEGMNEISFELLEPNGLFDIDEDDNAIKYFSIVDTSTDLIPLRKDFEDSVTPWSNINSQEAEAWKSVDTFYGESLSFYADSLNVGQAWLVSPSLNFSSATTASMFVDLSAAPDNSSSKTNSHAVRMSDDSLRVLVSRDCGVSYSDTVLVRSPLALMPTSSQDVSNASAWRKEYINLNAYAGLDNVRVAIVMGGNKNRRVYVDNIEVFLSDDATPLRTDTPYSLYGTGPASPGDFYVTFKLAERQNVRYSLMDMNGRILLQEQLENVLNQTYLLEPKVSAGIYCFKVQIGNQVFASKVFLNN